MTDGDSNAGAKPNEALHGFLGWLRQPVMAKLIRQVLLCRCIMAFAILHVVVSVFSVDLFRCPLLEYGYTPCPGCGLTRGIKHLLTGNFQQAIVYHLFAPLAVFVLAIMLLASVVPARYRKALASRIEWLETLTAASQIATIFLFVYWIYRLAAFQPDLTNLLRNY